MHGLLIVARTWKGKGTDRPVPRAGSRGLLLPCDKHAAAAARPNGEEPKGCCSGKNEDVDFRL